MPRKKKFGEESVITSFRVPKSKKDKIREKVNKLIEKEVNGIEKEIYNEFEIEENEVKYQPKVKTIKKDEIKNSNSNISPQNICPYCNQKIESYWTFCRLCNKPLIPNKYQSNPIEEKKIKKNKNEEAEKKEKVEVEIRKRDNDKMKKKEIYEEFKEFL